MRVRRASESIRTSPTASLELCVHHVARHPYLVHPPRSRAPRQPRRRATTTGQSSRSARGTFASTKTSWSFFRRPARRSPGRRARTSSPGSSLSISHGPQRTGPALQRDAVVLAHGADPAAEVARLRPSRSASSSSSVSSSPRGSRGRSSASRRMFSSAAGMEPAEERDDLRRGSGRGACRGSTSRCGYARPFSRQYASVSSRQTVEQRADDAVLAPRLDPARRAAGREPVEDGLDLVGGRVAGGAEAPAGGERVAEVAELRLGAAPVVRRSTSAPKASRQKAASASDSSPRSPWFTWTAETR